MPDPEIESFLRKRGESLRRMVQRTHDYDFDEYIQNLISSLR